MKWLLLALTTLATFTVHANDHQERLEKIAKEIRRDLYIQGHDNVGTHIQSVDQAFLDEYVSDESINRFEYPLDDDQVESLYTCHKAVNCTLYLINSSSEYYSGYGVEANFVLLYESGKHYVISHTVYSE